MFIPFLYYTIFIIIIIWYSGNLISMRDLTLFIPHLSHYFQITRLPPQNEAFYFEKSPFRHGQNWSNYRLKMRQIPSRKARSGALNYRTHFLILIGSSKFTFLLCLGLSWYFNLNLL
jgi:hypothetical protein